MNALGQTLQNAGVKNEGEFDTVKRKINNNLVDKLDLTCLWVMHSDLLRRAIR